MSPQSVHARSLIVFVFYFVVFSVGAPSAGSVNNGATEPIRRFAMATYAGFNEVKLVMLTATDAAWLAGFLDGEGSFMICRIGRGGYVRWEACIAATSTDNRLVEKCKALVGGKLSRQVTPKGNARLARIWQLKGKQIRANHRRRTPILSLKT